MSVIDTEDLAIAYLDSLGIDVDELVTAEGLISYTVIKKLKKSVFGTGLVKTYRKALVRAKKYKDPTLSINDHVKKAVVGDVKIKQINKAPDDVAKKTRIEWLPSSAAHPDLGHQRHYFKRMTLYRARKTYGLANGNGKHFGCQCGYRIIDKKGGKSV